MIAHNKNQLTIYLCLEGSTIVGAGKTLPKLLNNTAVLGAHSYHFYYRKMRGKQELVVLIDEKTFKITKVDYAR